MPLLAVDPGVHEAAGLVFWDVDAAVCDVVAAACTAAAGGGGMAGADASGAEWAATYDVAARDALVAGKAVVDSLGLFGDLLSATGGNHAAAEDASSCPGGILPPTAAPPVFSGQPGSGSRAVSLTVAAPPPASGTGGDEPAGWWLIADVVAMVWPNGDEDRLRDVGAAWVSAGQALQTESTRLNVAIGDLSAVVSPETPDAVAACTDLRNQVWDLGDAFTQIGASCNAYADHLVETRQRTVQILTDLLAWSTFNQALGLVGAALTAGQSEWLTQGAQVVIIAGYATRVDTVLTELATAVRALRLTLAATGARIGEISVAIAARAPAPVRAVLDSIAKLVPYSWTSRSDWPQLAAALQQARRNKGMYGLPSFTTEQTEALGMAWVGPGAKMSRDGRAWVSADGLRQYRGPEWKGKLGKSQANIEWRTQPSGRWLSNGHIDTKR